MSVATNTWQLLHPSEMSRIRKIGNDTVVDRILNRDFLSPLRTGYVEVGENNFCLPIYYQDYEKKFRKFQVRDDDVYIAGHPKTGTTWSEEMVWLIVNNLDYARASKEDIFTRFPQLEFAALFDYSMQNDVPKDFCLNYFRAIEQNASPRCIKSHLHWSLLPEQIQNGRKQPKIIVVLRNAADVCVSLYYHSQTVESYKGTFEDFCELFLAGRVCFGPYWKQVLSYWQQRERSNILFIKFKEMKEDLPSVIRKVAEFLGKTLSDDDVEKLAEHLSFDSMKKNPAVNHQDAFEHLKKSGLSMGDNSFMRVGKVGGYKSMMSAEMIKRFEAWTNENLAGTELSAE